jgi:hypothetical protein
MLDATTTTIPAGEFMSRARRLASQTPRLAVIFLVLLLAVATGVIALAEGTALLRLPFNLFLPVYSNCTCSLPAAPCY